MTDADARRTLSVRGWFALAAITTFVMVVIAVLASVVFLGASDDTSQDRIARAATVLRAGSDQWRDPAWRAATTAELNADDVSFVLFEGGDELDRASGAAQPTADPAREVDQVVRVVEIDGTEPPLTAQLSTPLDDENPVPAVVRATLLIGGIAAAVSLAFGRPFIRPLRAVRHAARRVTEGDMAASLPRSRITEVDEVITAFDIMTTELDRSLEQQAELEHERRMFIAAVAHDLRTPLFSLRGYLEGLETGLAHTPDKRARYLAIANEKARTLDRLVADLFDYARFEYLDQSLHREAVDLAELLHDLVDGLRPQADAKGLTLELWPHHHACPIDADREQLARAVTNLVDNAIRYTPAGGRVDVACGTAADSAWFTVTDTGPGIAPADLPHLFQSLYRGGDRGDAAATGGTGLGLAIAQRILAAHDGTLEAGDVPGGGAVFTARMPARSEEAGGARNVAEPSPVVGPRP
jgi:signal transduction histidine kinase